MGCISGIVKIIMFVFNFLCLLIGLALLIVGSLFYVSVEAYKNTFAGSIIALPILLIIVGVFIFLVSFLGCCGTMKSSKCMLITYAVVLIVLLVVQLAAGIFGLTQVHSNYQKLKDEVKNGLTDVLNKYYDDKVSKGVIDSLQAGFKCCGVYSPVDYFVKFPLITTYPGTCCGLQTSETCSRNDASVYTKGCGDIFFDWMDKSINVISIVAIVICAIELLGALFAIYLSRKQ